MTPTELRECLQELVETKGWRVFLNHVEQEWRGTGFFDRMNAAIAANKDPLVVMRTAIEVRAAVQWPRETILELKGEVDE